MIFVFKRFMTFLLIGAACGAALGQQQLWSSQYVNWTFDKKVRDVWSIEQKIWIPKPNENSFWPMQWGFKDVDFGGYIGLQQGNAGIQVVRFSIWNATKAEGQCRKFDGEGIGHTCTLTLQINPNSLYTIKLNRQDKDDDGQWWGGSIVEVAADGNKSEKFIGKIKAPQTARSVNQGSLGNFVEYFGPRKDACQDVPLSIAAFGPPVINAEQDAKSNQGVAQLGYSRKADLNICVNGNESSGAFVTAKKFFEGGVGAIMFLGGNYSQHVLAQ